MGCQHGHGYQHYQDCERKLLHTGHFATIDHTKCLPTQPTKPPIPNFPSHHLDSSPHSPFTNCHTRFASTPQLLPQNSVFMTTPPTNYRPHLTILPCSLFSCVVTKFHATELLVSIQFSTPLMLHVHMIRIRYPPTSTASMCERKICWDLRV
jgi:hypothetical protein